MILQNKDPYIFDYMNRIGHFEFGLGLKPIKEFRIFELDLS